MAKTKTFHDWLSEFFRGYLAEKRRYSPKTIVSYKMTFNLARKYFEEVLDIRFYNMDFENFSKDNIYAFLIYLRDTRKCTARSLNTRLSAVRSFFRFIGEEDIELYKYYLAVKSIHNFKETTKTTVEYLTADQLKLLFDTPDIGLKGGRRNRFLMILMYECGLRLNEILSLKLKDIVRNNERVELQVLGKGLKYRTIPLLTPVVEHLDVYEKEFHSVSNQNDYLFYVNHSDGRKRLSPGTVDAFLKKYASEVNKKDNSFPLNLHAHMLRHSVAMSMYKNGIPISYIKDMLGHSDLSTTSIYAYADTEDIRKALETIQNDIPSSESKEKKWKGKEKDLLKYCGLE